MDREKSSVDLEKRKMGLGEMKNICTVHTTYAHSWELMIKKVISINNLLKALTQNVTSVNH